MKVAIDYQFCTHGNFLQYLCDVFVLPVVEFHDPFDKLGTAHARKSSPRSKFVARHYFGNLGELQFSHVIGIETDINDAIKIMTIRLHKMRKEWYLYDYFQPPRFQYAGIPTYYFKWESFFNFESLVNELQQIRTFLSLPEFQNKEHLKIIHQKFLDHHSYLKNLYDNNTLIGNIVARAKFVTTQDKITVANIDQIDKLCSEYIESINKTLTEDDVRYIDWASSN